MTVAPIGGVSATTWTQPTFAAGGTESVKGNAFTDALQSLQDTQSKADNLAVQAATGDLTDVHDYTIAATQAAVSTDLTVAVRNQAVSAFNEIMRMPL
jgi:flagellar hook-basal body complex protein FliE